MRLLRERLRHRLRHCLRCCCLVVQVLNKIIVELPEEHPAAREGGGLLPGGRGPLRESLGHTQVQVAVGAVLGVVIAAAVHALEAS